MPNSERAKTETPTSYAGAGQWSPTPAEHGNCGSCNRLSQRGRRRALAAPQVARRGLLVKDEGQRKCKTAEQVPEQCQDRDDFEPSWCVHSISPRLRTKCLGQLTLELSRAAKRRRFEQLLDIICRLPWCSRLSRSEQILPTDQRARPSDLLLVQDKPVWLQARRADTGHGRRSIAQSAATSFGAILPVTALYQMRDNVSTTFRSSPAQSGCEFH